MSRGAESRYDEIEENFERLEQTFRLIEIFNSLVEMLEHCHVVIAKVLESFSKVFPPIGLIFSGLGHLATLGKAKKPSKTRRLSQGIKLFTGMGMLVAAVVGILVPPLGLTMLSVGAGLSVGRTLYKMWRTSSKLGEAKAAFKQALHRNESSRVLNDIIETKLNKHSHKMINRKINASVAVASFTLITLSAAFPPAILLCSGLLIGLNLGYTLYRVRKPISHFFRGLGRSIKNVFGGGRPPKVREQQANDPTQQELKAVSQPECEVKPDISRSIKEEGEGESDRGQVNAPCHVDELDDVIDVPEPVEEKSVACEPADEQPEPVVEQNSDAVDDSIQERAADLETKMDANIIEKNKQHEKNDFLSHEDHVLEKISLHHQDTFAQRHGHMDKDREEVHNDDERANTTLEHEQDEVMSSHKEVLANKDKLQSEKVDLLSDAEEEEDEGEGEGSLRP